MINKDFFKKLSVSCLSTVLAVSCATGMMPVSFAETADGSVVVTYSKGTGTFASGNDKNEVTIKDGKVVSGTYEVPTRDYWTFRYWQNSGQKYTVSSDGVAEGVTEDITLAPSWESNMYYFSFYANGGTFQDNSVGHSIAYKANKPDEDGYKYEIPTRDGYTFAGWVTESADGTKAEVLFGADGVPTKLADFESGSKTVLKAVWRDKDGKIVDDDEADTVVISYNANGGTGDTNVEAEKGTEITAEQHVSRTGYTFKGWSETASGAVKYNVGDKVAASENKTLYAVWEAESATADEIAIKFDANGGTGVMSDEIFTNGESKALTLNSYTKEGFSFKGWALSPTGDVQFEDGATMTATKDAKNVTLYAIWLKAADLTEYSVSFDANGGEGTMDDQKFTNGVQATLDKNTFVRPGYTFKGWAFTKDGEVVYTDAMNVTIEKNTKLYAVWSKKSSTQTEFTVSFDPNGGDGAMDDLVFKKNVTQHLTANTYTRTGYTFKGWSLKAGGEVAFEDGEAVTVSSDQTLYAVWSKDKVVTYTVKFNTADATGTMSDQVFTAGTAQKLSKNTLKKEGYTFVGWSENKDGSVKYKDEESVTMRTNITLYPIFSETKYTVKFDANGGTGSMKDQVYTYGTSQAITANSYTRDGYNFLGWSTDKSATKATYTDKQTLKAEKDMTLYAVWEAADLTITYKSNGGTGSMSDQTFKYGSSVTLTKNSFKREGYNFKGWALSPTGDVQFEDGATMTATKDAKNVTLYAIWLKAADLTEYSVSFDANGGEGTMDDQKFTNGVQATLDKNTFVRPGYTFKGWAFTKDGEVVYTDAMNVTIEKNTKLYAVWSKKSSTQTEFTVSFDPNGGDGAMDDLVFKKNVTQHLTANTYTRTGYTFKGWSLKAGGEVAFEDGEAVTVSSDQTLYAVWSKDKVVTYTVKFNTADATGTMSDQVFTAGTAQKLSKNTLKKEGYTFVGWSENKDGSVKYKDEESVTMRTNITLYPIFSETKYTVKFDANGGTGSMKDQVYTYGTSQAITANSYTRDGYNFLGWSTDKSATKATYTDKQTLKAEKDMTLYAVWEAADLTITYKSNGGTGSMSDQTFKYGSSVTLTKNSFKREGYNFKGWAYRQDATEIALSDGETKSDWKTGAILWAVWEKSYSDITVYANDDTNKTSTISASALENSSGKLPKASSVLSAKAGYTFKEWNTAIDGSGTSYKDEATIKSTDQPTVLFAIWTVSPEAAEANKTDGPSVTTISTTSTGASGTTVGGAVSTGDTARTGIMLGLAGVAAAIAAAVAVVARKKKNA